MLEMGGYYDDRDFDQLELSAYQRLYLNGGPFPTEEGQIGIVAGTGVGGGTVDQLDQLPAHPRLGARGVGTRARPRGPRRPRVRRATSTRSGSGSASTPTAPTCSGPHRRLKEACEALGYDFRPITRNADPDLYDPASAAYMGFGDHPGSKRSTAKTYLLDAQRAGARIVSDCRAERILVEDGRAAGVEAVYTDPEPANGARPPGSSSARRRSSSPAARSSRRRLLLRSGIGGPGGRRLPAPAPDRGDHGVLRRAPGAGAGARRRRRSRTSSPTSATATASCSRRRSRPPA